MGLASFYSHVVSDTIDFRFRFSAESPSLLSVAHTVSAECDTSLSAYFRLRPKLEMAESGISTFGRPVAKCIRGSWSKQRQVIIATGENGDKTATNPTMSVTICVDLNAISITVVVHLHHLKFHLRIELR